MKVYIKQPELMGIFGFSWQEKVAGKMIDILKGTVYESSLKSFWSPGGKNTEIVNNLERIYLSLLAQGRNPISFSTAPDIAGNGGQFTPDTSALAIKVSAETQIDIAIVNAFFRSIYMLARAGTIPVEKWNPKGYAEAEKLKNTFESERGILDKFTPAANTGKMLLIIAGVAAGAFALSQLKGFTK